MIVLAVMTGLAEAVAEPAVAATAEVDAAALAPSSCLLQYSLAAVVVTGLGALGCCARGISFSKTRYVFKRNLPCECGSFSDDFCPCPCHSSEQRSVGPSYPHPSFRMRCQTPRYLPR